jgi:hypothetical protein
MKSNIKKQFIWLFTVSLMLTYVSCSHKESIKPVAQNDNNGILGIIERYYKMQSTKTEGSFMFQSNLTNNDPQMTKTVIMGGFFNDTKGVFETDGGDVSIGGKLLTNRNGWYGYNKVEPQAGMYGTNVTFSLNPPISQGGSAAVLSQNGQKQNQGQSGSTTLGGSTQSATIYSPKAITITNVAPRATVKLVPNTNTTLTWNADPLDSNGVVIIADYLPARILNYYTNKAGNTHAISSSELVTDNGSTTIPWSFFSSFPVGSHITLWVARGNYTILANKDYSYKVGGYTAAAVWDITIPYPTVAGTFTASSGWTYQSVPSYISTSGPAVSFQIIVSKNSGNNVNYNTPFQIGTVSSVCIPRTTISFNITQQGGALYTCVWKVPITNTGAMSLQLVSGTPNPASAIALINGSYNEY